ncbi:MAG: hypothetical protein AAF215_33970 [Cyanobacteria bacterium P01_A01_bin.123]
MSIDSNQSTPLSLMPQSHKSLAVGAMVMAAIATVSFIPTSKAQAQSCVPLGVVEGESTEVTKVVSPPGLFVLQSNWNTDFIVPSNGNFTEFVATVVSTDGTIYDIDVNLKYSDNTVDMPYSRRSINLVENEPLEISVPSRVGENPFQVNLRVGGIEAEGNTYTASVMGCR